MLRELSLKAKRRPTVSGSDSVRGMGTGPPPPTPLSSRDLTADAAAAATQAVASHPGVATAPPDAAVPELAADTSPTKPLTPTRGLAGLQRRLSRGPSSFHRTNSFLQRYRAAAHPGSATPASEVRSISDVMPSRPTGSARDLSPGAASVEARRRADRKLPRGRSIKSRMGAALGTTSADLSPSPDRAGPPSPDKKHAAAATASPATPPRVFPKKNGLAAPLISMDELFKWRPTGAAARCVSSVPLSDAAVKRFMRGGIDRNAPAQSTLPPSTARGVPGSLKRLQPPRLLLCHDFRDAYHFWEANAYGAYGDDCPSATDAWRFNHWAYVDIFVYFSHYRVTIPPVGYIQAAHRHGALVLGTLIFESADAGVEDLDKLLASFKTRTKAANQLAAVAKFYGFDGWLVNVEVALHGGSTAASDLAAFVSDLSRATRKVVGPVSEVVWYDSVTREGSLAYQNELNDENDAFFKAAGSIFTNYHWDRNAPVRSAVKAGTRRTDVFTGIDVHGRNTFGGGGFHTHIALRAIKQGGTSAAIFAPAWTLEKCPPTGAEPRELEERFWTGPTGRFGRECVAQYFRERAVIIELPFSTSFDPGWGPCTMRNGLVKDDRPYFNLSMQQVQPSFLRACVAAGDSSPAQLSLSHEKAYNGSAAIKVEFAFSESRMLTGSFSMMRMFVASVACPSRLSSRITKAQEGSLRISYTYFAQCGNGAELAADDFGLVLLLGTPPFVVLLVGKGSKWNTARHATIPRLQVHGKFVDMEVVVAQTERRAFGAPVKKEEGSSGWMTRSFVLQASLTSGQKLSEVMVVAGGPPEQPVSVRPSPFMTPSQGNSRHTSRQASRTVSRVASRAGSKQVSRSTSPTRGGRESRVQRDKSAMLFEGEELRADAVSVDNMEADVNGNSSGGVDPFGRNLLNQYRESFHTRRVGNRGQTGSREGSDLGHGSLLANFERRGDNRYRDDDLEDANSFDRLAGGGSRALLGMERRDTTRSSNARGFPYESAFQVDGDIDYERMETEEDATSSGSRALHRLSSRLATPLSSRPGSRFGSRYGSLMGSRQGSLAQSLAASRNASAVNSRIGSAAASRQGSRFVSPTQTPGTGGGGAIALEVAGERSILGRRSGVLSPALRSREGSGLGDVGSGAATPGRHGAAINELKSALMVAAGSMAGEKVSAETGRVGGLRVVYLGELKMEIIGAEDEAALPAVFTRG